MCWAKPSAKNTIKLLDARQDFSFAEDRTYLEFPIMNIKNYRCGTVVDFHYIPQQIQTKRFLTLMQAENFWLSKNKAITAKDQELASPKKPLVILHNHHE